MHWSDYWYWNVIGYSWLFYSVDSDCVVFSLSVILFGIVKYSVLLRNTLHWWFCWLTDTCCVYSVFSDHWPLWWLMLHSSDDRLLTQSNSSYVLLTGIHSIDKNLLLCATFLVWWLEAWAFLTICDAVICIPRWPVMIPFVVDLFLRCGNTTLTLILGDWPLYSLSGVTILVTDLFVQCIWLLFYSTYLCVFLLFRRDSDHCWPVDIDLIPCYLPTILFDTVKYDDEVTVLFIRYADKSDEVTI